MSQNSNVNLLFLGEYGLINQLYPELQNKLKEIVLSDRRRSPENQILPQSFHKVNCPRFDYVSDLLKDMTLIDHIFMIRPLFLLMMTK